jgi:Tfp pilus assembly protein FimV
MFGTTAFETSSNHHSPRHHGATRRSFKTSEPSCTRTATLETVAVVMIAILLLAAVLLTRGPSAASLDLSDRLKVRSGDSLWTVATSHPVDGLSTAQLADLLADANGLRGQTLSPGQVIRVPRADSAERVASR